MAISNNTDNKNNNEVSILLVGIGGYGSNYVNALFYADEQRQAERDWDEELYRRRLERSPIKVVGAVEPALPARGLAEKHGIPLYESIDAFYAKQRADLAILSTPIHLHCEQIKKCLANGSNVLCEKPLCATVDELSEIEAAIAVESPGAGAEAGAGAPAGAGVIANAGAGTGAGRGLHVWVGYQLSFSRSVRALKNDILCGAFGKPLKFKTIVYYPRDESYYARNSWAGRKRTAEGGRLVLDSPIHNATAHHINNMLFLLGDAPDRAAMPISVQAELYRGNPDVDNFDTAALRCETGSGVPVLFYTSHSLARTENVGPICQYRFERATIVHMDGHEHESFYVFYDDGTTRRYSLPYYDQMQKLWDCIDAIRGGALPTSGIDAAAPEVVCANGAQLSHPVATIPKEYVRRIGEPGRRLTDVDGLDDMLFECYDNGLLPSELETSSRPPWASPGKIVALQDIVDINGKL